MQKRQQWQRPSMGIRLVFPCRLKKARVLEPRMLEKGVRSERWAGSHHVGSVGPRLGVGMLVSVQRAAAGGF